MDTDDIAKHKEKLFKEEPENFYHRTDIVCGLVKQQDGKTSICFSFNTRSEMVRALGELQVAIIREVIKGDMATGGKPRTRLHYPGG